MYNQCNPIKVYIEDEHIFKKSNTSKTPEIYRFQHTGVKTAYVSKKQRKQQDIQNKIQNERFNKCPLIDDFFSDLETEEKEEVKDDSDLEVLNKKSRHLRKSRGNLQRTSLSKEEEQQIDDETRHPSEFLIRHLVCNICIYKDKYVYKYVYVHLIRSI